MFFLGFCPDKEANQKIRKVSSELGKVFDDFDISVRWSNPNSYHMVMVPLDIKVPFIEIPILKYKLLRFCFSPFRVVFNTSRLGISRKYKELIYLDVKEGGEEMREMYLDIRKFLGKKDQGNFIPHLVLGRISKDLTDQEYTNISRDLSRVAKGLNIQDIHFFVNSLKIIKTTPEGLEIVG